MADGKEVVLTMGGSCSCDEDVRANILANANAYCKANKKGDEAEILDVRPGARHKAEDAYQCVDGFYEYWVKFSCR